MKAHAKVEINETLGILKAVVVLEDGRGFQLMTGTDRLSELEVMIKQHARGLFNVELTEVIIE